MKADDKSEKTPDGLHIKVKLMTEAERQKCEAEAQALAATPEGDALEEAVRALKGEPPPPAAPPSVEWVEDDTYHETMDSLREVARLADRGRHAITADEVLQMQSSGSEWMTYGEVAEYLAVAVGTVRNWVSARKIPYSKRGGMVRFKRGEIDAWLAKTRKGRHHKP